MGVLLAFGVEADLAIVAVLAYRAVAIWIPAPIGVVALGHLRRTMARWEREDAAEPELVVAPQPEADVRRRVPAPAARLAPARGRRGMTRRPPALLLAIAAPRARGRSCSPRPAPSSCRTSRRR